MINSRLTSLIYPKKIIPNNAVLFRNIKYNQISESTLRPLAANFKDKELSCDWNKYSTPILTRSLLSKQYIFGTKLFKDASHYFVSGINVKDNLDLNPAQNFQHNPLYNFPEKKGSPNNRSHSLIIGNKDEKDALKARAQLTKRCQWEIFDEHEFKDLITSQR
jgi:hypothetical protein